MAKGTFTLSVGTGVSDPIMFGAPQETVQAALDQARERDVTDERKLLDELIVASQILVTVSRNAATVLSEEFQDMITGPADSVQAILDRCPSPDSAWDGIFREEDVEEHRFTPDMGIDHVERFVNSGVKLTHRQTQLSVEAYQSDDYQTNRSNALRALTTRVRLHVIKTRV